MQEFGFEKETERRGTHSAKWDTMDREYQRPDMVHMGVADMDFQSPEPVRDALKRVLEKGVLGYTDTDDAFFEAIQGWYRKRYGFAPEKEWIVFCPRINIAAGLCVNAFTAPGEAVMMHTPAYGSLKTAVEEYGRRLVSSPLVEQNGRYEIDFEQMEQAVTPDTRMLILCNPHNPVGRCWNPEELKKLAEFCRRHDLIVFSDEIHGDLIKKGCTHVPALSIGEELNGRLIVASSPAKTFNIPGVILSFLVIPDAALRKLVEQEIYRVGMHNPTVFAQEALVAAYTKCDDWCEAVNTYIDENEELVIRFLGEHFQEWTVMPREGTYLLWIDCRKDRRTDAELEAWFLDRANVSVYMGEMFGPEGKGFLRVNIATSRRILQRVLDRMLDAKRRDKIRPRSGCDRRDGQKNKRNSAE